MQTPYVGTEPVSLWWSAAAVVVGLALLVGVPLWREWKRQVEEEAHRKFIGQQTTEGEP